MNQQPNNIIKLALTKGDLATIILTLHEVEQKMVTGIRNETDRRLTYSISKLSSQLDTAAHALGQCEGATPGDCAYETNQVTHYRLFKDLIEAEIKPGNKTV